MKIKKFAIELIVTFVITLLVSIIVTYLYSLAVHGKGTIDWETSVRFAIIFAIVLSWVQQRGKK